MTEEKKEGESDGDKEGLVRWFSELTNKDVSIAGGKGASLGEMYNNKFPIPPGFVVTAAAYRFFLKKSGLGEKIENFLDNVDIEDTDSLKEASNKVREIIKAAEIPGELEDEILEAYEILDVDKKKIDRVASGGALEILKTGHEPPFVAVRSSATTEDLADASFAGQQETFLNVKGEKDLLLKVKDCFSSLFTARAIYYREKKGFDHSKAYLAVVVQKMVDSEKSGVMFSKNPVKDDESIIIEAVWGLGEGIVSGMIKPDTYIVDKDLENFKILDTSVSDKKIAIVRTSSGKNEKVKLTEERSKRQVLNSYEIKRLSQYSQELENHYNKPQDIEFAIEGSEIYIVQSRPITTKYSKGEGSEIKGEKLLTGLGASPGVSSGEVKIIHSMNDLGKIKKGDVLVTTMTNPDMVVAMQKSAGIVTDEGGITSHASIVSREMGIPAVVGTGEATEKLKDGQIVTVDGNSGSVFEGKAAETKVMEVREIVPTKTKIKVIVDLPDFAERAAKSKASGVGLIRLEGIIASSGKHPIKFVKENKVEDYVKLLVNGLKKIAGPFEEIWIRSSDIRSDEYRNLDGAPQEVEGNPMLGDHGIRFSLKNPDIMKAELTAVKETADEFHSKKIGIMMPQIISVDELKKTKDLASEIGMPKNVRIGIMVETPAAVQLINDLCREGVSFISFGTNDLTQYTLAIDRNNSGVQNLYNEMNPAVLSSIAYVIRRCKKYGVETSLCGQAGSREDMVNFLVRQGIDSISVNADAAYKISRLVAELENEGLRGRSSFVPGFGGGNQRENPAKKPEKPTETGIEKQGLHNANIQKVGLGQEIPLGTSKESDIEEEVLKVLEEEDGDYEPGSENYGDKKREIPPLNDAIPVESDDFNREEKEREVDFG